MLPFTRHSPLPLPIQPAASILPHLRIPRLSRQFRHCGTAYPGLAVEDEFFGGGRFGESEAGEEFFGWEGEGFGGGAEGDVVGGGDLAGLEEFGGVADVDEHGGEGGGVD